ncbi:proteasome accessory factor PafA2 [Corynebacterium sp. zg-331]|uniref:depupylase/deamidase Dop n=1 Tax=unclassified Corynebacterium TaxID=2624378 RepID=UPI00128C75F5|nr:MULTISPECIES: depupylase/deamidase Dop [unclassified Corynebacterium]MBC3185565.1 proteasome accessory factor PafA2 [Corynebacterium sp. zg-331]MPV52059.1 proteasome accessory factor PafA2 [Corynebacterium sp. zg331]
MARFLGTETEYGIATPSEPGLSPIITSSHAVVAYAAAHTGARSRWDYQDESPLRDTRGFDLRRYHTVPVVDPDAVGVANVMLPNGARLYVDHAHPEYSSPECADAWQALLYDAAGDVIISQAIRDVQRLSEHNTSVLKGHEPCPPLKIYKNNVDGKGASYGSHENYHYSRDTDFEELSQALIPFFVTRQVLVGAGRMGIGEESQDDGFQISQRADYFRQEVSLETTLNRGIINTRDEPHADAERYGRLHVIVGDANRSHTSTLLKLGMTSLVIDAVEAEVDFSDLRLCDPVGDLTRVSRDLDLRVRLALRDGRELTALEILAQYRARVRPLSATDARVLAAWDEAAALLAHDPMAAAHLLDWVAKYALIRAYQERGATPGDPRLRLIDLQYSDVDPQRSLYSALVRKKRMRTLLSAEEIARAAVAPPAHSRAWLRGQLLARFPAEIAAASWQSLALDDLRLSMPEVGRLTEAEVGDLVARATSAAEVLRGLEKRGYSVHHYTPSTA